MFFKVLACDFDGTLASEDLGPAVPGWLLAELDRRGIYYQAGPSRSA